MPLKKGQRFGGRKPGTPNKINKSLAEDLIESYRQLGSVEWLMTQATVQPQAYLSLLGKLLPTRATLGPLDGSSDGEYTFTWKGVKP